LRRGYIRLDVAGDNYQKVREDEHGSRGRPLYVCSHHGLSTTANQLVISLVFIPHQPAYEYTTSKNTLPSEQMAVCGYQKRWDGKSNA
jgi:hypothetical protein